MYNMSTSLLTLPEIHSMYLGNKEICYTFKTCYIIPSYLPQNAVYLIISSCALPMILVFCINCALKFEYPPDRIKARWSGVPSFTRGAVTDLPSVLSGSRYLGESRRNPLCLAWGWTAEPFERRGLMT